MKIVALIVVVVVLAFLVWPFVDYLNRRRQINSEKPPPAAVKRAREQDHWNDDEDWPKRD